MTIILINIPLQSHVSPKLQGWSLWKKRNRIVDSFGVSLCRKRINSFPGLESWWTRIARIVCMMGTIRFRNSSFSQPTCFFSANMKNNLYVEVGVMIDQKWQKCLSNWDISIFQLVFLENYRLDFFYQGLNWCWYIFRCFLGGTISDYVPSMGILVNRKCKMVHLTIIFRRS